DREPDITSPGMAWARACLELMFRFHGMPFVDLAHLRKSDLKDGYLTLRRRKTGMPLSARVDGRAMQLLERYRNRDDTSPYLLCFLDGNLEGMAAYRDYQRILRLLNSRLRALALWKKVQGKVTSYSARHTWATVGRYCHIPIEVISEGLGHASVTTTEGYMKGFGNSRMDRANKVIMNYIFKGLSNAVDKW
ncbi:tyrosine-type recombinase/integrase, partial [Bacteroides uniformis]